MADTIENPAAPEPVLADPTELATIMPLEYDANRLEHSVIYFTTEWDNLVELLKDPVLFMRERQDAWPRPDGSKEFCWKFRAPITAILCAGKEKQSAEKAKIETLLAYQFVQRGNKELEGFLEGPPPDMEKIFESKRPQGFFYAEFALETSVLTVTYWAPFERKTRFENGFTRGVIGFLPGFRGTKRVGTLHIDVDKRDGFLPGCEERAKLVVDYIESRQWFVDKMNDSAAVFDGGDTALIARGNPLDVPIKAKSTGDMLTVAGSKLAAGAPPTVTMEGLSATPPSDSDPTCPFVCCNLQVFDNDNGELELGDLLVKCYNEPQPPCKTTAEIRAERAAANQPRRAKDKPDADMKPKPEGGNGAQPKPEYKP